MLTAILTTVLIVIALAIAMRAPQEERLIKRRPYNNHYSDASAARDGHL